ncbi:MAG TPA: efflux RND transporter permease subunit [Polyangiaceae bacterium LLY-WYZ-15_(1-7)]|nr:multidrug transporter AcrB [Sandaracinus sp.]MBJ74662.1 multidrug transporter AcrB [Sandaracinus sp.]HJL07731.1 efflux RND transporter permease subunit [Polyangiaceae bacterium LLY-WYZ-15_(1-7)]HJL25317.1 efflux RND transporter permease subunit [Polyangiaceae bacterium LLY-WYZ-15_(1-7)]HJL30092.1 efflux RND transporter permease subunit [Polyangiaceae bacterium LLY-WYZ-15_(1-7)]
MSDEQQAMGFSARVAGMFIRSKLTPLIILVSLALGILATYTTAREEDPSVTVTVADVLVAFPGRGTTDVDERIARPVAAWILELPTVEHVISSATDDGAMFVVQFREGIERDQALSQLYERLNANRDSLPAGVPAPLVVPRGIEDVPVLAVTLWHETDDAVLVRRLAAELATELEGLPGVSRVQLTGGARREIVVELDASRLAERGLAADRVVQAVQAANVRLPAGELAGPGGAFRVETGALLSSAQDVEALVVGATSGGPVYLRDIATVRDGVAESRSYVSHLQRGAGWSSHAAVTLALHKIRGVDAAALTERARGLLDRLGPELLPRDVHLSVTRDAGRTATHRVVTLIEHMAIATLVVVVLIALALGRREAVIVAIVIPATLAIVPFVYKMTGFTLNRMTLSAMIFAIGILVDDAIVIIENIHRHYQERIAEKDLVRVTLESVREVGNPTILATFTVVAALMPTAFVSGMIGQFLRALPIGASVAMVYSLFVALVVTPYLAYRLLRHPSRESGSHDAAGAAETAAIPRRGWYRRSLEWVMARRWRAVGVWAAAILMLLGSLGLVVARVAVVKMLPLGDVDEMSVMIDLPPTSTLEETHGRVTDVARALEKIPEIVSCQAYVGTAGPITFQGVARHYMLRQQAYQAELQIQLAPSGDRSRTSHEIAAEVRRVVSEELEHDHAWFTVAELPPGPPVQASLVAEVYGPDEESRMALAQQVKRLFETTPDIVDVDWSARRGPPVLRYDVDQQRAAVRGVVPAQVATTVRTLVHGDSSVWAHLPREREPVAVRLQLARAQRASEADLRSLYFSSMLGTSVPASDVGSLRRMDGTHTLLRKDLQPFVSVTAEVTGAGPIYSAIDLSPRLREEAGPGERPVRVLWNSDAPDSDERAVRWGGEWTVTYELFRDLGAAFAVVLLLIYVMLVAWYHSFLVPWIVMLPIPMAFIGVIPGHVILGKPLSGMAVIGVIALAGLMVRNSILLVDLARQRVAAGMDVREAVLLAGETRLRPILLTALTVVLGDGVLFFDPLLQGLGLTMASGALFATALTLGLVPLAYYQLMSVLHRGQRRTDA